MNTSRLRWQRYALLVPLGVLVAGCAIHASPQTAVIVSVEHSPGDSPAVEHEQPIADRSDASAKKPRNPATEVLPVGYWRFEEGSGRTVADLSGNGNDGGLVRAAWSTDRAPVEADRFALAFDGDSYVRIPASTSLTMGSTFTLAAWIKAADPTVGGTGDTESVVAQARPEGGSGFRLGVESGRANLGLNNGEWNCSLSSKSMLVAGRWTHIAATYDGATMKVYVDGVAEGTSGCASGALLPSARPVYIGREFDILGGRHFDGLIDEARVYDTVFDASSVRALFEDGRR